MYGTSTSFRDVNSDLKEMGVASAVKGTNVDLWLQDIFDVIKDTSDDCLGKQTYWANVCPAEVVAALNEDLLMSDEELSSGEEDTLANQQNHDRGEYFYLRLSLVAFQLWRVLEQLAPEIFWIIFSK